MAIDTKNNKIAIVKDLGVGSEFNSKAINPAQDQANQIVFVSASAELPKSLFYTRQEGKTILVVISEGTTNLLINHFDTSTNKIVKTVQTGVVKANI